MRKWEVTNYFFWEAFGVVAPETCLESRYLKRKAFERDDVSKRTPAETFLNKKKSAP
jgi:hypothetical protein